MNHLSNYFQRGAVILLVAIMLLTIPNMNVYSSIGSFQTTSTALTANQSQKLYSSTNDRPFIVIGIPSILMAVGAIGVLGAAVGMSVASGRSATQVATDITSLGFFGIDGGSSLQSNNPSADDEKHNFSKFDN